MRMVHAPIMSRYEKSWLQMADLYYQQEEWTKAERAYNEFVLLYPGAARCDYAHYKAVEYYAD